MLESQKINSITDLEYAIIIASLKYLLDKRYNCNSATRWINPTSKGGYVSQEVIDRNRVLTGCFKKLTSPKNFHRYNSLIYTRCVCNFFDYKINSLLELNEYYNKTFNLPQLYIYKRHKIFNKTVQAIKIVNNFIEDKKAEEMRKAQEAAKKGIK